MNIDTRELTDTYDINMYDNEITGWMKEFELVNPLNNQSFTGRLYWNSDDGYSIYWDTNEPKLAKREDFEYALDNALIEFEKKYVPYNTAEEI
jgi:hypothetical protein